MRFRTELLIALVLWCSDFARCGPGNKNGSYVTTTVASASTTNKTAFLVAPVTVAASVADVDANDGGTATGGVYEVAETEHDQDDQTIQSQPFGATVLPKTTEHSRSGLSVGNDDDQPAASGTSSVSGDDDHDDLSDLLKPNADDRPVAAKKSNHVQKVAKNKVAAVVENRRADGARDDADTNFGERRFAIEYDQSDVQWLKRLFDVFSWDGRRLTANKMISDLCNRHMSQYLQGLRDGLQWADKSEYLSFFGTHFRNRIQWICLQALLTRQIIKFCILVTAICKQ